MQPLVIGYLQVRFLIGLFGVFLVPLLIASAGWKVMPSVSHYYYTPAREVLTVLLASIGVMLLAYKGYDAKDRQCSLLGGLSIIAVALAPVDSRFHLAHMWAAYTFFLSMSALAWRFSYGQEFKRTFKTLATVITVFTVLGAIGAPAIVVETGAIVAFGLAWLLKGKVFDGLLKIERGV